MAKKAVAPVKVEITSELRILVLYGEDRMRMKDHVVRVQKMLKKTHGDFEEIPLQANRPADLPPSDLFDSLRTYSLLSSHRLIILDLQGDGKSLPYLASNGGYRELFERYAKNPSESATLIIRAPSWKKGNLDKYIAKVGAVVPCNHPTENEAIAWVCKRAKHWDATIDSKCAHTLTSLVGTDLLSLDSELGKLACMAEDGKITQTLVEREVEGSNEEKNYIITSFALQALVTGKPAKALTKLHDLIDLQVKGNDNQFPMLSQLTNLPGNLLEAKSLLTKGMSRRDVVTQFRMWSCQDTFIGAAQHSSNNKLLELQQICLDMELRAKGGGLSDPRRALEILLVRFAASASRPWSR